MKFRFLQIKDVGFTWEYLKGEDRIDSRYTTSGMTDANGFPLEAWGNDRREDNPHIPEHEGKSRFKLLRGATIFKRQFGNAGFIELPFSLRNQSLVLLPGRLG